MDPPYLQQFSSRSTTVGTLHATSLQGFGYGDVVHQFEKHYKSVLAHICQAFQKV